MTTALTAPPAIGAYDAKSRLSHLLDRVERGEQFVITRHGHPIARLVPEPGGPDRAAAHAAVAAITALRQDLAARGVRVTQDDIRALRDEGRR
ncbi:MAG: type II toxin-antitoxin system prevent-host-death family antitoxin [Proteobacteria bacterium]|nr:type II toxin-antitoxin system prevent-host-death family antitoxin [Pseudomonadota bacterium]